MGGVVEVVVDVIVPRAGDGLETSLHTRYR